MAVVDASVLLDAAILRIDERMISSYEDLAERGELRDVRRWLLNKQSLEEVDAQRDEQGENRRPLHA